MSNEFIIESEGRQFFTGMQKPEIKPLFTSFTASPPVERMDIKQLGEFCRDQKKNKISVMDPKHGWGKLVGYFDQGRRSSCNAYMIAIIICILVWRQSGRKIRLSPEWVYSLINRNKDGGSMLDDGMEVAFDKGMPAYVKEFYQRYKQSQFSMEEKNWARRSSNDHRFGECHQAAVDTFEHMILDLYTCLARFGCVGLALHASQNFVKSGWEAMFDDGPGNHAVAGVELICLSDNPQSIDDFRIVNLGSWNKTFGKNGFTLLKPKHLYKPGQNHAMYCVTAATTSGDIVEACRVN